MKIQLSIPIYFVVSELQHLKILKFSLILFFDLNMMRFPKTGKQSFLSQK